MANGALDNLAVTEMENADSSELIVLAMKGPPELNRNYRY